MVTNDTEPVFKSHRSFDARLSEQENPIGAPDALLVEPELYVGNKNVA